MASVTAFNDMMGQFLVELHKTFPEEKGTKKMMTSFDLLKSSNPRLVVDAFMQGVSPYADKISAKDESFLLKEIDTIDFLKDLNIKSYWDRMTANTRAATWQVPPDALYARYDDHLDPRWYTQDDRRYRQGVCW